MSEIQSRAGIKWVSGLMSRTGDVNSCSRNEFCAIAPVVAAWCRHLSMALKMVSSLKFEFCDIPNV